MADEVSFEWDESNREHIARHNVMPEEAEQVLMNEPVDDGFEVVEGEERWTSVGHTNRLRILRVVWTHRQATTIRIVTAFDVSLNSAREYIRAKVGL